MKEIKWTTQLGSLRSGVYPRDKGNGVAVGSFDNIFVTGKCDGDLDGDSKSGNYYLILLKYNSDGVPQ